MCEIKVTVPQQAGEVTQLLCLVHMVAKDLPEIQDYQVPLTEENTRLETLFSPSVITREEALLPLHMECCFLYLSTQGTREASPCAV